MLTERLTLDGRSVATSAGLVWSRTNPYQDDLQGALQAPAQDIAGTSMLLFRCFRIVVAGTRQNAA